MVLNESTVRGFRAAYLKARADAVDGVVEKIESKKRGNKFLMGDLDADLVAYIKKLREAGGIVNRSIVIAAAHGILSHLH